MDTTTGVVERGGKNQMQQYIENKRSRRVTFATRRNGLKKKLHELTTLCDVEACFVCYGTDGELETWPEDRARLAQILDRYTTMDKKHRDKNKIEVPSRSRTLLLEQSSKKKLLQEEISGVDDLSNERLAELHNLVESKLQQVKRRIQFLINSNQTTAGSSSNPSMVMETASALNYYSGNPNPNPMMQQPPMMPPTSTIGFPPEMMMTMMQSGINYIPVTHNYLGTTYHGFMPVDAPLHSNPPHSS